MVFIVPPSEEADCLHAYIVSPSLPDADLAALKTRFERAAALRFNPAVELLIQRCPAAYAGLSRADMRRRETAAGRDGPFVVIDDRARQSRDGAVWYVGDFADADMVRDGVAASTDVLLEMLVRVGSLALTHVNASIGNQSIDELLRLECGVEAPLTESPAQARAHGCDEPDDGEIASGALFTDAECIAAPGETEESTDPALLDDKSPRPDVVVRLKEDVARRAGLVFGQWCWKEDAEDVEMPDGTTKSFPAGSLQMAATYDMDFDWPKYEWPEGSL